MSLTDCDIYSLGYLNWPHDRLARWLSREKGFTVTPERVALAFERARKHSKYRPKGVRAGDNIRVRPVIHEDGPVDGVQEQTYATIKNREATIELGNALEHYWIKRMYRRAV